MPMSPRLLRPIASGGFNPKRLAGLSAWYDATVASSITLTSGFVSQWNDLSGTGHHLTQSVEADRPGTGTIGGKTAIDFDGSNDYLSNAASPAGFTYGTIFCVHSFDNAGSNQVVYTVVSAGAAELMAVSKHTFGEYRNNAGSGGTVARSGGTAVINTPRLTTNTFNSGTSAHGYRLDGAEQTGTTGGFFSNVAGTWLGLRNNASLGLGLFFDGQIGEWVIYNRVLSADEIAKTETYLAAKWGVALA